MPTFFVVAMAADSDGDLIETVVTCQGDLTDPDFPSKFQNIVDQLNCLLCQGVTSSLYFWVLLCFERQLLNTINLYR